MKISIFAGDISDAPAEALCTSTNPRLSLVMGTGASVRGRGGFEILRACEAIVEAESLRTGVRGLPPGSVHTTTAGQLPAKIVIHCVASDASHRSSAAIIRQCVANALTAAATAECTSIAMPLFGTGHAHFKAEQALTVMAEALRDAAAGAGHVMVVIHDPEIISSGLRILRRVLPGCEPDVMRGPAEDGEGRGMWRSHWGGRDEN